MLGFVKSVFTPITNERPLYLKINRYSILTNFKQKVIKKKNHCIRRFARRFYAIPMHFISETFMNRYTLQRHRVQIDF